MSFIEITKNRYTTKLYDANAKISDEDIEKLKDIIRLSPSSINSQPWKFTFVGEGEMKRKLADLAFWNRDKINAASHLVVFSVIDDIALFKAQIDRKSTRLNSSHVKISYAVFCLKKKKKK